MDTSHEDFVREHKKTLRQADKRLEDALKSVLKLGKDVARHDKALQDAKDLSHLAHRELRALDNADDTAFATDRSGLEVTLAKLQLALDGVKSS